MNVYENVLQLIGKTPIVKLNKVGRNLKSKIYVKLEYFNPGSSIKDRIAFNMIEEAEKQGLLHEESHIVEPTSGNTGIGLALVGAVKGYRTTLIMPENASVERKMIMKALGAEVILVSGKNAMEVSVEKAHELSEKDENVFVPQQFKNPANPDAHRKTTALEIIEDMDGEIDAFVAAVGTGGTITGTGEALKEKIPDIKVIGLEPKKSPVLSGGEPQSHNIPGMGAGFIPEVLNQEILDEIIKVSEASAFSMTRILAQKEGIFCGISAGAAVWAALEYANWNDKDQNILVIIPDTGERYLSTDVWAHI